MSLNIQKLAEELGLFEGEIDAKKIPGVSIEDVTQRLDRMKKLDQVNTVTFGLETDDGKVVKVYVNEEDEDKFDKIMSDALGTTDSIEDAINKAATEVDIVDVEWPEADEEEEELEGSEVMDPDVHSEANKKKAMAALATKKNGGPEGAVENVTESIDSIADRFVQANQQLVYQAIIDLGIPEEALSKSTYRSSIIRGIKETAAMLATSPQMKVALKQLVKHRINFDDKSEKSKKDAHDAKDKKLKESKLIENAATDLFWTVLGDFARMIDDSPAKEVTSAFLNQPKLVTLVSRSTTHLQRRINAPIRTKLNNLATTMAQVAATKKGPSQPEAVEESLSSVEVEAGFIKMLNFSQPKNVELVDPALSTVHGKRFLTMLRRKAAMLPSTVKSRLEQLFAALDSAPLVEAEVDEPMTAPETTDGYVMLEFSFDEGEAEKAVKAIENSVTTTLSTTDGKKVILSPRMGRVYLKAVGGQLEEVPLEQVEQLKANLV